jgi:DNA-directed RNA polymerase subunit L/regulator of replication initiation timing
MEFDMNNNHIITPAFANAIRRILLAEIPMITMSSKKMNILKNTTMLNDSMLMNRLTLIPLNQEWIESTGIPYDQIEIRFSRKNQTDNMISIYLEDFEVCHILPETLERRIIKNHRLFIFPRILFGKMKMNQELQFTAMMSKKTSIDEGSIKNHTCKSVFTYNRNIAAIRQHILDNRLEGNVLRDFLYLGSDRMYYQMDNLEPATYCFSIESIGVFSPDVLFKMALDYLEIKLRELMEMNESKVTISPSKVNFKAIDFLIENENDTLGNLITAYITKKPEIIYCGYCKEHPLIPKMIIRLSLEDEENISAYIQFMKKSINELIEYIQQIRQEWNSCEKIHTPIVQKSIQQLLDELPIPSLTSASASTLNESSITSPEPIITESVLNQPQAQAQAVGEEEGKKKKRVVRKKKADN